MQEYVAFRPPLASENEREMMSPEHVGEQITDPATGEPFFAQKVGGQLKWAPMLTLDALAHTIALGSATWSASLDRFEASRHG